MFHELLRLGLLWRCMLLEWLRPWLHAEAGHAHRPPAQLATRRSPDPKPWGGLPHKPRCEAWESAQEPAPRPPCCPPPRMVSTWGRRREGDTPHQFCPTPHCADHGWVGWGHLGANGHPGGGPWRPFQGRVCQGYCHETQGTPWHGVRVPPQRLVGAVGALAEGLGSRAVARVFEVHPHPGLAWLLEVAAHAAALSRYCLHHVHATPVPRDALLAWLRAVKVGKVSEAEAIQPLSRAPHGIWGARDPVTKWLLTRDVGDRPLAVAPGVVHHVVRALAPEGGPLFGTEGFKEETTARLTPFGPWGQPPRPPAPGPVPKPRGLPLPPRGSAPVGKSSRRRRGVRVRPRVVFGTLVSVNRGLEPLGWQINTAFIERANLTIRPPVAAVGRRVITVCTGEEGWCQQLALSHTDDTVCWPHASVRVPLRQPETTHGTGSATRGRPRTPAMAAGLTDQVWPLREVRRFRVPPWLPPQEY